MLPGKSAAVFIGFIFMAILPAQAAGPVSQISAHSFSFPAPNGGTIDLSEYKGKVIMVVNTASQCSFTTQYGPLQALQDRYADRGFVVIGVPTNEFGGQEPGSDAEIAAFTKSEFSVDFPITAKTRVKGSDAEPFYRWAKRQVGTIAAPRWNFHKYIIDPEGNLSAWFTTFTEPDAPEVISTIESLLPAPPAIEATINSDLVTGDEQG